MAEWVDTSPTDPHHAWETDDRRWTAVDSYPQEAWQRVGSLLAARRGQIDPRYRVRKLFAEQVGLKESLLQELEGGKRTTFRPSTLAAVERGYRIAHGSIYKALQDPTLTEFPDRAGESHVELTDKAAARDDLTVHTTEEPDPSTPPGTPAGFSDGAIGVAERLIWLLDSPWRTRWDAIQVLRGNSTTPIAEFPASARDQHIPQAGFRREA
jgi:hypothetical protein